jgi:hypothetical protein
MDEKDKSGYNTPYHMGAIPFLMIGIIIVTGIFSSPLIFNQNHTAIAQRQEQSLASKGYIGIY